ncbi:MAG: ribokinase [Acidobacteriota bacterium]
MRRENNGVVVVGSANMDLVAKVARFPEPGETVLGASFEMFPGGKGANQAVACAKLGGKVEFIARMGKDIYRDTLAATMTRAGVGLGHVFVDSGVPTGTALITVDSRGQNEIVVISGSNMMLTPEDVCGKENVFAPAAITLLQLEIPLETVVRAAEVAQAHGHTIILNPAPARKLPRRLLKLVDILTPNESEAELLTGIPVTGLSSAGRAGKALLATGVKRVILTMGSRGCLLVTAASTRAFPARKVKAVDSTAAGDAFNGALAFALAEGRKLEDAVEFAGSVAAFSVTRMGAQRSMPTMRELKAFISRRGSS